MNKMSNFKQVLKCLIRMYPQKQPRQIAKIITTFSKDHADFIAKKKEIKIPNKPNYIVCPSPIL